MGTCESCAVGELLDMAVLGRAMSKRSVPKESMRTMTMKLLTLHALSKFKPMPSFMTCSLRHLTTCHLCKR